MKTQQFPAQAYFASATGWSPATREQPRYGQHCHRGATAMKKLLYPAGSGIAFALLSSPALADANEDILTTFSAACSCICSLPS